MARTDGVRWTILMLLGTGMLLATASNAAASGFWNTPSNICQWAGYGNGGGYHAPLVLGPMDHCRGLFSPNVKRFPQAPAPPYDDCCYDACECEEIAPPEFITPTSGADSAPQPFTPPAKLRIVRLPPIQTVGY